MVGNIFLQLPWESTLTFCHLRYLCELAGTAPADLLEEEYALLVMMSAQPKQVNNILTTNRGSRYSVQYSVGCGRN